ncbi:hypothetical protein [Streptococcus zhangguiae]|uniref:DUF418 domain-containing protein n=1 Tax=Streptococcus zhangguiae TaxID=2664091 RepID=A0A6I4RSW6_9STRE|nr:hypothetical protein [Streptococcus sp. zg-70]MWV55922.1 hypothetical protein [Streptococcus sp. zg-70]
MNYFIYGDSLTGQLYKTFETKQFSMNQHAQLFIYIIAAMIIKQINRIYIPFSSLFFNIILLVIMMFLIMMRVWQQLKEWENFIVYQIFKVSKIKMKDIS